MKLNTSINKSSINITEFIRDQVFLYLDLEGCECVFIDINAFIFIKDGKIMLSNTLNCKFLKGEKTYSIENYSNTNKNYDSYETKWFINIIKDIECKAILKYSGNLLNTVKKTYPEIKEPMVIDKVTKTESLLKTEFFISCSKEDLIKFLTEIYFIRIWTYEQQKENEIAFENILIKEIKKKEDCVAFLYKWKDWKEFSKVKIDMKCVGNNTKVQIEVENVPIDFTESVKNNFKEGIFKRIGRAFNCIIKDN